MDALAVQLDGAELGDMHTCRGAGISPHIRLGPLDPRARSLAVVVIDPFEPGCSFSLWLAARIPPTDLIPAGMPADGGGPLPSVQGTGHGGRVGWQPPCPRKGDPPHLLTVKVYALDEMPALETGFTHGELVGAMRGHVLQFGSTNAFVR